jgi:hypothetical protein
MEPETNAQQIDRLARFILMNFMNEPSRSEGAVDVAIRLLERLARFDALIRETPRE